MEFEPNHRNSQCRAKCCAMGCNSKMNVNQNLSFHRLPKSGLKIERVNSIGKKESVDRRMEWLRCLGLKTVNKSAVICSKHFDPSDFYLPNQTSVKRRFLKPNAVPRYTNITGNGEQSLFESQRNNRLLNGQLPEENKTLIEKDNNECMREDLNFSGPSMEDLNVLNVNETIVYEPENHDDDCEARLIEELCDNEDKELCSEFIGGISSSIYQDKFEQVKIENFVVTLSSFVKTKADLKAMCNIMSFEILDKLIELLDEIYPSQGKQLLSTRDCIILTIAKLKLDIPFNALAVFYKSVSEGYVRNIFYVTVKKLATILQSIIRRVPKKGIECNKILKEFREASSILNCTEVKIQKPKCSKCQVKFYLHYQGQLRVKFMTEVTPAGLITFVSKSFIGGISNNTIFSHNEISQHLELRGDMVMVNQGFFVDDEYIKEKVQIKFLLPKEDQLSEETMTSRSITRTRVHIERISQQIRQFKILENKIPWHMINYLEDIFIICCGLTNLDSPILADDEF